jgi:DNA-binding transcriptional LysR family regulator
MAIVRSDAVEEPLTGIEVGALDFCWVVPRSRLPGKTAAGIHLVTELPIALLSGDGKLAKGILSVAEQHNVRVAVRLVADNFGLIIEALRNAELAAVLPMPAAEMLSKERFAVVELKGMESLRRELSLVYHSSTAQIRESIRQTAVRVQKALIR